MPTSDASFWETPQGAAKFKHRVVKGQLGAFAGKLGHTGHSPVYIDGYAGPGAYEDGQPASPQLAAEVGAFLEEGFDLELRGYFIEKRPSAVHDLRHLLKVHGFEDWPVFAGTCEDHLPRVLREAGDAPVLLFLDPYGLGLHFDQFVEQILRRPRGTGRRRTHVTEVLVNFSISALRRKAGFLDKDYPAEAKDTDLFDQPRRTEEWLTQRLEQQERELAHVDAFLGGRWWREEYRAEGNWTERVVRRWIESLREAAGTQWDGYAVDVPDHADGPAAFILVLLTQSPDGAWEFNQNVSLAHQHLYEDTYAATQEANTLFGVEYIDPSENYARILQNNVRRLVQAGTSGTCQNLLREIYGDLLGKAREKHLRQALRALHREGAIGGGSPSGALKTYELRPPSP